MKHSIHPPRFHTSLLAKDGSTFEKDWFYLRSVLGLDITSESIIRVSNVIGGSNSVSTDTSPWSATCKVRTTQKGSVFTPGVHDQRVNIQKAEESEHRAIRHRFLKQDTKIKQ